MVETVGRWSRIFFVGFAFVVFGIGGLLIRLLLFPLLHVLVRNETRRAEVARDFIGWSFR